MKAMRDAFYLRSASISESARQDASALAPRSGRRCSWRGKAGEGLPRPPKRRGGGDDPGRGAGGGGEGGLARGGKGADEPRGGERDAKSARAYVLGSMVGR